MEEKIVRVLQNEEKVTDEKMFYCINKINCIIEKIKECLEENEVIWFLNERSKDNQHRRDMEIKSIESIDYLSIITLKKPRS